VSIAVIIPCYNRAHMLGRAVDSIFSQQLQPGEIIVVDDGSTDDTESLIRTNYGAEVHYLRQPNAGVSAARNRGLRFSSADWLAFLDSDDTWLPEKLALQWAALQSLPDCRIIHSNEIWVRNGRRVNQMPKHRKYGGRIYQRCLPLCVISPSSVLIHREVFEEVGLFDESLPACEDYDLWLRISAKYPVHYIEEPLIVKHGGHLDQLSRRYWGMDRFRIQALVKMLGSDCLDPGNRAATVATLREKIGVYIAGANKRKRRSEVEHYQSLMHLYCSDGAPV
jgi:glycosyltransferase involved in cell wall biosynthesis